MSPEAPFRHFHEQLTVLNRQLLGMSEKAESLVDLAVDALINLDEGKAELVIASDHELDAMELEIEAAALELLALQQPMARDLRFIVSAIKVTSDLERVGDHAVNIAQAALRLISQRLTHADELRPLARKQPCPLAHGTALAGIAATFKWPRRPVALARPTRRARQV